EVSVDTSGHGASFGKDSALRQWLLDPLKHPPSGNRLGHAHAHAHAMTLAMLPITAYGCSSPKAAMGRKLSVASDRYRPRRIFSR
ncbi:hypothetical protein, partial [Pseudomonas sp. PAH14]|uniref:hypothetical protein n=1 Tax=Pseudomonas sp. PAH14 TaxID=2810315 RepID=UPI001BDC5352